MDEKGCTARYKRMWTCIFKEGEWSLAILLYLSPQIIISLAKEHHFPEELLIVIILP